MNPTSRTRLMLHSHHKAHRLEADLTRMTEVLAVIASMAENGSAPMPAADVLRHVAKLARAALAGAAPADARLAASPDARR